MNPILPATYAAAGVDYSQIDPTKVLGIELGALTAKNSSWCPLIPMEKSRGESAYVFTNPLPGGGYLAHVIEGLGTKDELASWIYTVTGDPSGYFSIAQDAVAMIVNDLLTTFIPPYCLHMHLGVGRGTWLSDKKRMEQLMNGWKHAADLSKAVWAGGETPVLLDTIMSDRIVLAGSGSGYSGANIAPVIGTNLKPGDRIIAIESSGVHANGITMIWNTIASGLNRNQQIELYEQALQPTKIYADLIHSLRDSNLLPNYIVNITGHGWRKLMRHPKAFNYCINETLPTHEVFTLIQKYGNVENKEMWSNYNMGTGFCLMVDPRIALNVLKHAHDLGYDAIDMGVVLESPDCKKRVIIEPEELVFEEKEMTLR